MNQNMKISPPLNWTGHKTDLVEFIHTIHGTGAINNGQATISEVAGLFEEAFNSRLKMDVYRAFLEIKERRSDPAKFINCVKVMLAESVEEKAVKNNPESPL